MTYFYGHFRQCNFNPPKEVWVYPVPLKGSSKNTGSNDFFLHYSHPGPASNDVLDFEEASPNTFYTLRILCRQVFFLWQVHVSCNFPSCRLPPLRKAVKVLFVLRFVHSLTQPRHVSSIDITNKMQQHTKQLLNNRRLFILG
jgi:hypothetical protein